ncbi:MAG: ABC transporter substrate-binding protein [Paludibacteraceae bacterium]|nr:ABC transporter substrate-binding protein [Paludibacteraceae bacterium]
MKKLLIFFSILLPLFFFSCSNESSNKIRIGIPEGPSVVSFIKMMDDSLLIAGEKVEFIVKSDPQQIEALMMQNKVDFAILPTNMAANLYNKGVAYKMIACPVWGTLYVLSNLPEVKKLSDLQNRKVGVFGQGTTADILFQKLIQEKGIGNVFIDYRFTGNFELSQALRLKKINIAVISEPLVSKLLKQDSSIHIVEKLSCEEYLNEKDRDIFVQTAFLVNEKVIRHNPQIIKEICNAYRSSCNYVVQHPDEAADLLVKRGILPDTDVAKKSILLCSINYVGAFAIETEIYSYLKIFYDFNPESIGGKLPSHNFIFREF